MCDDRPWRLTAPWWRWNRQRAALGLPPRGTVPVLQKYEAADPVTPFQAEPQRSLAFTPEDEVLQSVAIVPRPVVTVGGKEKRTRWSDHELRPTGVRKLFLASHRRFYLVVCELHCDAPGLPSVRRDRVCEAGFVVRRTLMRVPAGAEPRVRELLSRSAALQARIAAIDRGPAARGLRKRHRRTPGGVFGAMTAAVVEARRTVDAAVGAEALAKRAGLESELAEVRAELLRWRAETGAAEVREGWVPSAFDGVGSWRALDETPAEVVLEKTYPLFPLVPDAADATHDAAGRTVYFGLVPTLERDTDAAGTARFDARTRYAIRCYVRRHVCDCPRSGEPNDCGGALVWSEPTEAYQLAAHFDPVGTGNHPVTIQLPDLPALAALASTGVPGSGGGGAPAGVRLPVAMVAPPGSGLLFNVDAENTRATETRVAGGEQVCFFAIPLITIVALFVLNLFLPIVVFLFQLWFLLGLKLCIPPSFSIAAGADAQLDAELNLALQAELGAAVSAQALNADPAVAAHLEVDLNLALTGHSLATGSLAGGDLAPAANSVGLRLGEGDGVHPAYANTLLAELGAGLSGSAGALATATGPVTAGLAWEARVERAAVGA